LAFAYRAFGFMYFGDLWNFLDLLHRFCKSPQLVLSLAENPTGVNQS